MNRFVFIAFIAILTLWLYLLATVKQRHVSKTSIALNFIDGVFTIRNVSQPTEKTVRIERKRIKHVPKIMLELYERNLRNGAGSGNPEVVKSIIPESIGE